MSTGEPPRYGLNGRDAKHTVRQSATKEKSKRNTTDGQGLNTDFTETKETEKHEQGRKTRQQELYRKDAETTEKRRDGRRKRSGAESQGKSAKRFVCGLAADQA